MISALKLWMRLAESQKMFRVNLDSTSTRRVWVYRRGKRTKSWAVCSSLLFSSLSFSSQVIVDNYNKSYNAVHLSHTQTLPSLPSSLCLPLTLWHQDGSRRATLWASAFITLRDVCPRGDRWKEDEGEIEEEEGGKKKAGRLWNHAGKVLWVQRRKEASRMSICHKIHGN